MRFMFATPFLLHRGGRGVMMGGVKSDQSLIAALVAGGHEVEVVGVWTSNGDPDPAALLDAWMKLLPAQFQGDLPGKLTVTAVRADTDKRGGQPLAYADVFFAYSALVRRRIQRFDPAWVLSGQEHTMEVAGRLLAGRRNVLRCQTTNALPFGPRRSNYRDEWGPITRAAYRRIPKILVVSDFLRDYVRDHGGFDSAVQPNLCYGLGPYPTVNDGDGEVVMVNPTEEKGTPILVGLAQAHPAVRFRVVVTYGQVDPVLQRCPNVRFVEPNWDITEVLRGARLLLAPALYGEAFGMIVVDALLRGIPVLAADDGGLPEAGLGVARLLSVVPLSYRREPPFYRRLRVVPAQPIEAWSRELELLGDQTRYDELSRQGKETAEAYVHALSVQPLEEYLAR